MRRDHTARAKDRLHDESGDGARPLKRHLVLQRRQAQLRQPRRVAFVERIAIGVGGRDMMTARQQRFIGGAETGVAVDRGTAKMGAVIALFQAEIFHPTPFAAYLVVLPGQTQRGFHAVGPAAGEERAGQPVGFEKPPQLFGQFDHTIVRGAAKDRVIGQPVQLRRDGILDRLAGIAKVDVPQAADGIDHLMPVDIPDPGAGRADDDGWRLRQAVEWRGHRVPQAAGVVGFKEVFVFHGRVLVGRVDLGRLSCRWPWKAAHRPKVR